MPALVSRNQCPLREGAMILTPNRGLAEAGDIVLLYADESEALTHPYLARAWARRGADLRVPAPGQAKKVAMMGALDWIGRKLTVTTSRTKRSIDFIALLEVLDRLYGPRPGLGPRPLSSSSITARSMSAGQTPNGG